MRISKIVAIFILTPLIAWSAGAGPKLSAFEDAKEGRLTNLKKTITSKNINNTNEDGQTITMLAAGYGQNDVLDYLILEKADLNKKDSDGNTALYFAISNEHLDAAKKLIENNVTLSEINEVKESALVVAVSYNNVDLIKMIIKKQPSLLNLKNEDGFTPIMKAAISGSNETIKTLVDAGANLKAKDNLNRNAYQIGKQNQKSAKALNLLKPKK